jgi:hypothetical protein
MKALSLAVTVCVSNAPRLGMAEKLVEPLLSDDLLATVRTALDMPTSRIRVIHQLAVDRIHRDLVVAEMGHGFLSIA